MRKLLNTLYITKEDAYLTLDGETVCVHIGDERIGQFPLHTLEGIVIFSFAGASPALMGKCVDMGISIAFFSPYGKFLCRAVGRNHGNVLLRKEQYRISDNEDRSCLIARNFILGKLYNCRWNIDRTLRDHELRVNVSICRSAINVHQNAISKCKTIENLNSLRGIEGECALSYFEIYDELILNQKDEFIFHGRSRRPPLDNVNAMLSFGYTMLANDCASALEGVGLDSYVGFMHRDRPGRKSLALDLMEELRPILVDRFVITLINTRKIRGEHFEKQESGAVEMTTDGRKIFLAAWQEHKREEIIHPFLKMKIQWGLVPHVQALLLARHLRDDLDGYPPFLWK